MSYVDFPWVYCCFSKDIRLITTPVIMLSLWSVSQLEEIKCGLLDYLSGPLCLNLFSMTAVVVTFAHEVLRGKTPEAQHLAVIIPAPILTIFIICSSPEILRTQVVKMTLVQSL